MKQTVTPNFPSKRLGAAHGRLLLLAALILIIFLSGIGRVVQLRYSLGDVYPPYSTLRYDPLGASALYHALESMPGLTVKRHQRSLSSVSDLEDTTLFLLGAADSEDPVYLLEEIESFVQRGNRLVVAYSATAIPWWAPDPEAEKEAFEERQRLRRVSTEEEENTEVPVETEPSSTEEEDAGTEKEEGAAAETEEKEEKAEEDKYQANITERWGYTLERVEFEGEEALPFVMSLALSEAHLPEGLETYSPLRLTDLDDAWEVRYQHEDQATVMERAWGEGSIVLLSGSYLFSNEAIRAHRYPAFLSWVAGAQGTMLFDETHLGIEEQVGVMALIKRFRLVPLLLALLLLAALHSWKSVATLTPRLESAADLETLRNEEGQSDAAGLTNLMRRGVPSKQLLQECYRAWQHDFGRDARYKQQAEQALRPLMDGRTGGAAWQEILLNNYAAACKALRRRR